MAWKYGSWQLTSAAKTKQKHKKRNGTNQSNNKTKLKVGEICTTTKNVNWNYKMFVDFNLLLHESGLIANKCDIFGPHSFLYIYICMSVCVYLLVIFLWQHCSANTHKYLINIYLSDLFAVFSFFFLTLFVCVCFYVCACY